MVRPRFWWSGQSANPASSTARDGTSVLVDDVPGAPGPAAAGFQLEEVHLPDAVAPGGQLDERLAACARGGHGSHGRRRSATSGRPRARSPGRWRQRRGGRARDGTARRSCGPHISYFNASAGHKRPAWAGPPFVCGSGQNGLSDRRRDANLRPQRTPRTSRQPRHPCWLHRRSQLLKRTVCTARPVMSAPIEPDSVPDGHRIP
jgi:hypothetical protein